MKKIYIKLQEILDERKITRRQLSLESAVQPYEIRRLCDNEYETVNLGTLALIAEHLGINDVGELMEFRKPNDIPWSYLREYHE